MYKIIPHINQILNIFTFFFLFLFFSKKTSVNLIFCECGHAQQHHLDCSVESLFHSFTWHFLLSLSCLLLQGFLTRYSAACTDTGKWDGGTNQVERIKGEEEEQVKGYLSKYWWLINVALSFQPHLKHHLIEASCYLRGGKKHSLRH